jgi:hypothetical protein
MKSKRIVWVIAVVVAIPLAYFVVVWFLPTFLISGIRLR